MSTPIDLLRLSSKSSTGCYNSGGVRPDQISIRIRYVLEATISLHTYRHFVLRFKIIGQYTIMK